MKRLGPLALVALVSCVGEDVGSIGQPISAADAVRERAQQPKD